MKGNAIGDVLIVCALDEQLLVRMTSCCPLKNTIMKAMKYVVVEVAKVVCVMKERAKTETTLVPRLYREAVRTVSQDDEVSATLPTFTSIQTTLYRGR